MKKVVMAGLFLTLCSAVAVSCPETGKAVEDQEKVSPHAEALQLVMKTQEATIREVEAEEEGSWWHDTKERTWTVKRPIAPGIIDSTHMFTVKYSIDGHGVAEWNVDTRKGTVSSSEAEGK